MYNLEKLLLATALTASLSACKNSNDAFEHDFAISKPLTALEHAKVEYTIEQIHLNIIVFSAIAPYLDPLFDVTGEPLSVTDNNETIVADMQDLAVDLQWLLDQHRIRTIEQIDFAYSGETIHATGIAYGSGTNTTDDDYIFVTPSRVSESIGFDSADIFMHEVAHFENGSHSKEVLDALSSVGSYNMDFLEIVEKNGDFPYLMNYIMGPPGVTDVLNIDVPFEEKIDSYMEAGLDFVYALRAVYVQLLLKQLPFEEMLGDFIYQRVLTGENIYSGPTNFWSTVGFTPEEAPRAFETIRPQYNEQVAWAIEQMIALEATYGTEIDEFRDMYVHQDETGDANYGVGGLSAL